jgi:DNA-binding NarL/FixJ family response regulator
MARPKKAVNLTSEQTELLQGIGRSRETPHSLVIRTQIVLKAASGLNNKRISQELGLCEDTI